MPKPVQKASELAVGTQRDGYIVSRRANGVHYWQPCTQKTAKCGAVEKVKVKPKPKQLPQLPVHAVSVYGAQKRAGEIAERIIYKAKWNSCASFTSSSSDPFYSGVELIKKESASDSHTVLGNLRFGGDGGSPAVAVKLFAASKTYNTNLLLEAHVYLNIVNAMYIRDRATPCLIPAYGLLQCDEPRDLLKRLKDADVYFERDVPRSADVYLLLLERAKPFARGDNYTLNDLYYYREKSSADVMRSVLFQLLYTILALLQYGVIHNDAHASNIFVEKLTRARTKYFRVRGVWFRVECTYLVRFFDFDRAGVKGQTNEYIEGQLCRGYGECNFDKYTMDEKWMKEVFQQAVSIVGPKDELLPNVAGLEKIFDAILGQGGKWRYHEGMHPKAPCLKPGDCRKLGTTLWVLQPQQVFSRHAEEDGEPAGQFTQWVIDGEPPAGAEQYQLPDRADFWAQFSQ